MKANFPSWTATENVPVLMTNDSDPRPDDLLKCDEDIGITPHCEGSGSLMISTASINRAGRHRKDDYAPNFDDIFSVTVRAGIQGTGLVFVVAIAVLMGIVSIIMVLQYQPITTYTNSQDVGECNTVLAKPFWADLLGAQIPILQNLIHASLLGGSGFVAAYRGDLIWLFFARNCAFFFGLAAFSFLLVDCVSLSTQGATFELILRLTICLLFTVTTFVAFGMLEYTQRRVRRIQNGPFEDRKSDARFPLYVAETTGQYQKANFIHFLATLVQIVAIFYTLTTTMTYVYSAQCHSNQTQAMNQSKMALIAPFEMAYGLGAHQAFLLSLLFLASTFPKCRSSVGGAILASSWRLLLALSFIVNLTVVQSFDVSNTRQGAALLFCTVEATLMVPILVTALLLFRETQQGDRTKNVSYVQVETNEDDGSKGNLDNNELSGCDHGFPCQSLLQIASLPQLSERQRQGAYTLWSSTMCLLVELTFECVLLLSQSGLGSAQSVYIWGMHVCAMYLFISHMSMSCPEVYQRARILLFIACPAGSLISLWQIWHLCRKFSYDYITLIIVASVFTKGLLGVFQTIGLIQLDSLPSDHVESSKTGGGNDLFKLVPHVRKLLFWFYIPCLAFFGGAVSTLSTCTLPLISSTTLHGNCQTLDGFTLSQNWPGLGLFFHFGGLLVIFTSDGLELSSASYPPSLVVGSLFTCHIGLLTFATHVFDFGRIIFGVDVNILCLSDYFVQGTLILWTLASIQLYRKLQAVTLLHETTSCKA